jgi:hypothetical protein
MRFSFSNKIIKYSFLSLIITSACILSCKNERNNEEKNEKYDTVFQKVNSNIFDNDTLIVDKTCAVMVSADSFQIEKRKNESGEDFYVAADDYAFYLNETKKFLDSVKLRTIMCNGKKYLKFINSENNQELINLSNLDELWKVYFFSPNKKSVVIDMTMINEEYTKYFK